jgi:hypothetical protein
VSVADAHLRLEHIRIVSERTVFIPHVFANARQDGTWEAWIEFQPEGGGSGCATERETTQPNFAAVEYWAQGLEPVYFEGAFERAVALASRNSSR